jgi:hypothetical protein
MVRSAEANHVNIGEQQGPERSDPVAKCDPEHETAIESTLIWRTTTRRLRIKFRRYNYLNGAISLTRKCDRRHTFF